MDTHNAGGPERARRRNTRSPDSPKQELEDKHPQLERRPLEDRTQGETTRIGYGGGASFNQPNDIHDEWTPIKENVQVGNESSAVGQ
jgi:hypothetical protein